MDNGSTDGTAQWLEEISQRDPRVRVVHCDHVLGEGAAKNIGLGQSLGRHIVMLDTSVEVTGDVLGPLSEWLADESIETYYARAGLSVFSERFGDDGSIEFFASERNLEIVH